MTCQLFSNNKLKDLERRFLYFTYRMEERNTKLLANTINLVLREQEELRKLERELSVKNKEYLEAQGYAIVDLCISDTEVLEEIIRVTLKPSKPRATLPKSLLRSGSLVTLIESTGWESQSISLDNCKGVEHLSGFVVKIRSDVIVVSLTGNISKAQNVKYVLKLLTNDIMYRRMFAVLNKLFSCERKQSYLHSILFEDAPPRFEGYSCSSYYNDRLNDVQKKAVDLAVTATDIALIHGPPGTGKTCTVVEIIRQLVARGKRLLVCGPSNVSVDNIGESLVKLDILFNRVGHPSKVSASVAKHGKNCLALAKQQSLRAGSGVNIYAEIHVILSTLCGAGDRKVDECGMDFDVVIIDECAQALEAECWIAAIRAPKLILAGDHHQLPPTLINSENKQLEMKAQSTKIASVIDDDILIPSLFMRAQNMLKDTACRMLKTQYRMNRNIMRVSSDNIYDGCLIASKEVESHLLSGLPNVDQTLDTLSPLVYIDTSGAGMPESFESGKQTKAKRSAGESNIGKSNVGRSNISKSNVGRSNIGKSNVGRSNIGKSNVGRSNIGKSNVGRSNIGKSNIGKSKVGKSNVGKSIVNKEEARLAVRHVKRLVSAGVCAKDIALVSPYSGQVSLLQSMCEEIEGVEIRSIDGFQGSEKEAVVLTMVRSNPEEAIGFLCDYRRINVAITRARRHLCVIADGSTISKEGNFLKALIEYLNHSAATRTPN